MSSVQEFKLASGGRRTCAIYLALALLAGALVAYATPFGLVIFSGDSVDYIEGARNIFTGHGYSVGIPPLPPIPIVTFPPLYSISIAAAEGFVRDPYAAARWVSVICFAASAFLLCILVWRATEGRVAAGLAAGLLFLINPDLLGVFTKGFSETLFIPLGLAGQALLMEYAMTDRNRWLAGSALLLGLTAVTRYSGVVWIAAGVCTVLLCARGVFRARLGRAFLFGLISMLPPAAMAIRNWLVSSSVAGRLVKFHPVSIDHLREGLETVASWFLPWRLESWASGFAVVIGLAVLTAAELRKSREPRFARARVFWVSSAAFSILFLAHLPLAISLVGYDTALNDRILAPLEVCAIVSLGAWLANGKKAWSQALRWAVFALMVLTSLISGASLVKKTRVSSGGYRGPVCRSSPLYTALRQLPDGAAIYSNKPEAVYLSVDKPVRNVPFKHDPMNLTANENASGEIAKMEEVLNATNGVILYVLPVGTDLAYNGGAPLTRQHEFSEAELKAMMPLQTVAAGNGAEILKPAAR